jgi:hypothetical protein
VEPLGENPPRLMSVFIGMLSGAVVLFGLLAVVGWLAMREMGRPKDDAKILCDIEKWRSGK